MPVSADGMRNLLPAVFCYGKKSHSIRTGKKLHTKQRRRIVSTYDTRRRKKDNGGCGVRISS